MSIFSDKLSSLMREFDLSDEQLAQLVSVNRTTVSRWRSGERSPKMEKLPEIAAVFKVDPRIFVGEFTEPQSEELLTIFDKLETNKKTEVVDFAKFKLQEQNKEKENNAKASNVKEFPSSTNSKDETIVDDDPFEVFAAHIDDDVTEEEMEEIIAYMKEIKKGKK